MQETLTLEFDGGSRGNPGPAGIGVVVRAEDGTPLVTLGRFIGSTTNNVAEYRALITGLQETKKLGARKVIIRGDSELVVRQIRGQYRVKHPNLRPLYEQALNLMHEFDEARIEHNLRHHNTLADKLANRAMDRRRDVVELDVDLDPAAAPALREPPRPRRFACERCGCVIDIIKASSLPPQQLRHFTCQCGGVMK